MKKLLQVLFFAAILFTATISTVYADPTDINLTIRDGNTIGFSGAVALPEPGTIKLNDNTGAPHSINAQSVLAVLNDADALSPDFHISNLEYYASFGSLYLKCITITATGEKCDNWQYTVNNSYPAIGMDQNILSGGENVYVYFGPQNRVLLSSNEITTADVLTVVAEAYDYQNNAWIVRTGITVGLTQPDPNNPWSPTEVQTRAVDANGQAVFTSIPVGFYNVGIQEDFYFPTEALNVINQVVVESSGGGGGGSSWFAPPQTFDVASALSYLKVAQFGDGSFGGSDMYTDWAAIAYGASGVSGSSMDALLSYMNAHAVLSATLTDNERRTMALLSLKQNPYSFRGVNYVKAILDAFDGMQFGDSSLVNDDIFALIPLSSAGYTASDEIITKDIKFIISKQNSDGSWEGSVDLSAAAIQALKPFDSISEVSDALVKAGSYLANGQSGDGGWNSVYSTSWAKQAESALGASWIKNGKNALDYLAGQQATDGAMFPLNETLENRIWATSYAIPAFLSMPWSAIMHAVAKQNTPVVAPVISVKIPEPELSPRETENVLLEKILPTVQLSQVKTEIPFSRTLLASAVKSENTIPIPLVAAVTVISAFILAFFVYRHIARP